MLAFASQPLLENLHVDLFCIIPMFVSYRADSRTIVILQDKETKLVIISTNLLWNIDRFLSPLKSDAVDQAWFINLRIYWIME